MNAMKSIYTVAIASWLLVGASSPTQAKDADFKIWTEKDDFKPGVTMVRSTPIRVKDVKFTSPWFALVAAGYLYSADGTLGSYLLDVSYFGSEWMFWDQLTVKVGEDVRSLQLIGQPRRDTVPLGLEEHLRFEVPRDLFEKMAAADRVDMRVNGKYYYDFFLNSTGTSYLSQLKSYVRENAPELKVAKIGGDATPGGQEAAASAPPAYIQELRELAKLRSEGILSEEEFQAKKKTLLGLGSEPEPKAPAPAAAPPKPETTPASPPPPGPPPPTNSFLLSAGDL